MNIQHEIIQRNYTIRRLMLTEHYNSHWHQRLELLMVDTGSFMVSIRGAEYEGLPGDVLVIPSGQIHAIKSNAPDSRLYVCTVNPTLLYQLYPAAPSVQEYITVKELEKAGIRDTVHSLFREMKQERDRKAGYEDITIPSRILLLCGLLMRHFQVENPGKTMENYLEFQEILRYISEHFREPVSLADIARQLNYSNSYVSGMFVTCTGLNFKTYLENIRVNEAIRLLVGSNQTVSNISASCGFESIRTFNNAFRRVTGTTPSQFRKGGAGVKILP